MKVVILAAGTGSRLGNDAVPKALTLLGNGQTILDLQVSTLRRAFAESDILISVGYKKEMIMERFPKCTFVMNSDYATENTSKSLLRSLYLCDEDTIWINGDVVFHPSVLEKIMECKGTGMVVNTDDVDKESMKYWENDDGLILAVSKKVKNPLGEALGINIVSRDELTLFRSALEKCRPEEYFEAAIEICLGEGMKVKAVHIENFLCTEIDFPEDLARANKMLEEWVY